MAPSRRKPTGTTEMTAETTARKIMTRSIYKKQKNMLQNSNILTIDLTSSSLPPPPPESSSSSSLSSSASATTTANLDETCIRLNNKVGAIDANCCSTPKGEKYMIPKISTCPPAPRKKKLVLDFSPLRRGSAPPSPSSATFFAHSELEFFFLYSPRNIQV